MQLLLNPLFLRLLLVLVAVFSVEATVAELKIPDEVDKDDIVEAGKGAISIVITIIQIVMGAGSVIYGGFNVMGSFNEYREGKSNLGKFFLEFVIVLIIVVVVLFFATKLDDFIAALT
ncbi:MAG: DUF2976 domain-containing protein [Pseudomonadales bacterium]